MQVPSAIAIMPPEPTCDPAATAELWSRVTPSISLALSSFVDTPPGMMHLSAFPFCMPPQSS